MMGIENKIEKASSNLLQALTDPLDPKNQSRTRVDLSVPSSEQIRRDYYEAEMRRE